MSRRWGIRGQLAAFSLLFSAGMWMSKVAQPLYFNNAHSMVAFGIGYAVMAVVGGFSFIWGALADRIGGLNAMRIGALAYAIGISGRVFTEVAPAVIFSGIAGGGASLALVGVRPWLRTSAADEEVPRVIAGRNLGTQIGVFVGTVGASGIFALAGENGGGLKWALVTAPVLVFAGVVWLLFCAPESRSTRASARPRKAVVSNRATIRLAAKLSAVGALSGFYTSLLAPYVPLYLTRSGTSDSLAALVVAAMSVAQIGVTAMLTRRSMSARPFRLFFFTELGSGLLTLAIAVALTLSPAAIAAILIVRSAMVALAVVAEETVQYAVIPGAAIGFVFGISQASFLVGDTLGGAIGGPLWADSGPAVMALLAGVVTLVNAFLMPALLRSEQPGARCADA